MVIPESFITEMTVALIIFIIGSQFTIFGIVSAIMVHIRHIEHQLKGVTKRATDNYEDTDDDIERSEFVR